MAPGVGSMPFAININSPVKNFDSGGMPIEGSVPEHGHLGAILCGPSATNQIRMKEDRALFSVFRKFDSGWAVIEHNTALIYATRLASLTSLKIINHCGKFTITERTLFHRWYGTVAGVALWDSPDSSPIRRYVTRYWRTQPRIS
ncbi:MAG: hypothetical protein DID90_2727553200 [Candidatus Nitrotoga sp. LAW]|nr:MAG: hypothetical protein DID90_2727553200 [Candidatus Nitrotoga sp. LAW]